MKKILITGASGFIGGFLVEEALRQGLNVYVSVRETSDLSYLTDKRIVFINLKLEDKRSIKLRLLEIGGMDYIIYNAGVTKNCDKKYFNKVNYQFTKNLIEVLYELNIIPKKFVQISSLASYGPGNEKTLIPIKESDTPKPVSLYGISKLKAEQYIKSLKDFPYLIFRPTGVYGPREKDYYAMYKSINNGFEIYIGNKDQHITFIYVKDLVRLIIESLNSDIVQKSYFVTDLKNYTLCEFNKIVKNELGKKTITIVFSKKLVKLIAYFNEKLSCFLFNRIPSLNTEKFKEISQKNWLCDSNELVKDFNFKPNYELEHGIHETIEWNKQKKQL
jgi:nucleoside-diphosphate-sugar epimerase